MYEAFQFKLKVYGYDVISRQLKPMVTQDDICIQQRWLWGHADTYMHRLALISTLDLPIPPYVNIS